MLRWGFEVIVVSGGRGGGGGGGGRSERWRRSYHVLLVLRLSMVFGSTFGTIR